ncbi:Fe2OG dioxygenase domain-containing protein [Favolaschia claudopus]|uniref:Fe2OG dioxygenase domain-containing protein n=1 Tax=Favolaschia claudopus TaxID=2862362 RepID=A0AAW0D1V9_9AGAR
MPNEVPQDIADSLEALRNAIKTEIPYTGGVHTVKPEDLVLYYEVEGGNPPTRRIDLRNASENELQDLANACQKATFGLNQADVLDETYRKAGKMDLDKFASRLDILSSGLLAAIKNNILQGRDDEDRKTLIPELYKLNVYGPGSFFKAHKDTPRGDDMIGSLVVVFPTAHEGGALTLEHNGTSWTFDSAAEITSANHASSVAYVAFYSDVTHSVETVKSGYRVTLTYNLFLKDEDSTNGEAVQRVTPSHDPDLLFEKTLRALLAHPAFLAKGGFLAFGLSHQYPMPSEPKVEWDSEKGSQVYPPSRLPAILKLLKGSDARIRAVSACLGLETHVKMLYDSADWDDYIGNDPFGHDVLADDVLNLNEVWEEGGELQGKVERSGTILERDEERAKHVREKRGWDVEPNPEAQDGKETQKVFVHWVTKLSELNQAASHFIMYGNEASISHFYGNAALFVQVPAFGAGVRAVVAQE